jgi:cytochrome oxidase Cu insertion factor (SCO1/SenC/PrrC family)
MKAKLVVLFCYAVLFFCLLGLYKENRTARKWDEMRQEYKKDTVEVTVRNKDGKILARW